jgi:hypothetical protein
MEKWQKITCKISKLARSLERDGMKKLEREKLGRRERERKGEGWERVVCTVEASHCV